MHCAPQQFLTDFVINVDSTELSPPAYGRGAFLINPSSQKLQQPHLPTSQQTMTGLREAGGTRQLLLL